MCKTHYLNVVGVGLDVSFGPDLEKNQLCVFPSRAQLLGQRDQTEMFGNMKCLNLGRLPGEIVAMSRRSWLRNILMRIVFPGFGGRESIAEDGMRMAAHHTRFCLSIFASTSKPEFQTQPSS